MSASCPHYLLFSQTTEAPQQLLSRSRKRWRFVLEALDGPTRIVADDVEPGARRGRLELLAVVRGLEALDGPSRVTLVTGSRYVTRGIRQGLEQWRKHNWRWERFGRWVPIRDGDLWQRVDRALQFHHIDCRTWRLDDAHLSDAHSSDADSASETEPCGTETLPLAVAGNGSEGNSRETATGSFGGRRRSGGAARPKWLNQAGERSPAATGAVGAAEKPQLASA
jgi:ribonuclease HI